MMPTKRHRGTGAQRQGRPAYENAKPRLRASAIERPFIPELERGDGDIFEGLFARLLRKVGR